MAAKKKIVSPLPLPRPAGARRAEALAKMEERQPAVAARFRETHGLLLSHQVLLLAAFWEGLTADERREVGGLEGLGYAPMGITKWYADGALDRPLLPGLDARLDARYRFDIPEFVTVMGGATDGLHFGFVHDEPEAYPWLLAQSYARDSAETSGVEGVRRTVLDFIHRAARQATKDTGRKSLALVIAAVEELGEASAAVVAAEHPKRIKPGSARLPTCDGLGPMLPDRSPSDSPWPTKEARRTACRSRSTELDGWIARAEAELREGKPHFALLLGRDLYFCRDDEEATARAVSLMAPAYRSLGRGALADIVEVHARHRELRSVDVFR
jgi:hypothetical protein